MKRISTTVVAFVGADARRAVRELGEAANVRAIVPDEDGSPLDRATAAWRGAARTHAPYLAHDADPLAAVADAWVDLFDGGGAIGEVEIVAAQVVSHWRQDRVELPDYYVVVRPDDLGATRRHWYFGFLHGLAPNRVVPAGGDAGELTRLVGHLRPGRWWPDLDRLLDGVERVAPDRVDVEPAESAQLVV